MSRYETRPANGLRQVVGGSGVRRVLALESGEKMQAGDRQHEHEPGRILPVEQERLGSPEIEAEQPDRQKQLCQGSAAAAVLGRLEIPERGDDEDEDAE